MWEAPDTSVPGDSRITLPVGFILTAFTARFDISPTGVLSVWALGLFSVFISLNAHVKSLLLFPPDGEWVLET